jgi:hypothetical protein
VLGDGQDTLRVTAGLPAAGIVLDARDGIVRIRMALRLSDGAGIEYIEHRLKLDRPGLTAIDVDAERHYVVHIREQDALVLELIVRQQAPVVGLPKHPALRVVEHPLRMQQAGNALPAQLRSMKFL